MYEVLPTEITADKKTSELIVTWSDRHTSIYPFSLLRNACPCEQCHSKYDEMGDQPSSDVFYLPNEDTPATRLVSVDEVGSYGVTIQWEDGHQLGIYSWHYLRALCPCPICREMMIYGQ